MSAATNLRSSSSSVCVCVVLLVVQRLAGTHAYTHPCTRCHQIECGAIGGHDLLLFFSHSPAQQHANKRNKQTDVCRGILVDTIINVCHNVRIYRIPVFDGLTETDVPPDQTRRMLDGGVFVLLY